MAAAAPLGRAVQDLVSCRRCLWPAAEADQGERRGVRKWMSLCMAERSGAAIPYSVPAIGHVRTVAAGLDTSAGTRGVSDPPGPPFERPIGENRGVAHAPIRRVAGVSRRLRTPPVVGAGQAQGRAGERDAPLGGRYRAVQ